MSTSIETIPATGWSASGTAYDTFPFPDIAHWPDSVELLATISSVPTVSMFRPRYRTFNDFTYGGIVKPRALFDSGVAKVEEPGSAVGPRQRLNVSPSVVTGRMSVRLQPAGPGRPVVEIHDAVGNVVRALDCTVGANGLATATWGREDWLGRIVPEGVYFCRYAASGVVAVRKVLVTHWLFPPSSESRSWSRRGRPRFRRPHPRAARAGADAAPQLRVAPAI
jgi:hypothetical protein